MSSPRIPVYRLVITAEKFPDSLGVDVLISSLEDHNDVEYSEGRVASFDTIERQLSDPSGEHFLGQATVRHSDSDHFWRARGDASATQYLDGRDAKLDVVSEQALSLGSLRTVLMRGKCRGVDLEDGLGATILLEELIGSEFGPAFLDKRINPRTFGDGGVFPALSPDLADVPVPIIVGENNDAGRVFPDGTSAEKGTCPGFYVGDFNVATGVTPAAPSYLPPPTGSMTWTTFGSGGNTTWTYAFAARTATGYTTLGAMTQIDNLPDDGAFTPSNGVILHLAQYPAALQQYVLGGRLYVKRGGLTSNNVWHYMDGAGEIFNTSANNPFTAGPHFHSGAIGYEDNGDDSHHKTQNPAPTTNTATIPTGGTGGQPILTNYGLIIFADSSLASVASIWGSDGGPDPNIPPMRVMWTLGGAMADVIDPTSPLWPYPNPWIELTGTDGLVRRYWGIFVNGPRLVHHKNGQVTIAGNFCGRPEDADNPNSTPMIDQFARVWQHMMSEQVWGNGGLGYYNGPWAGLPLFDDGTEAISSPSVQAAEAISIALTGTAKGYLSAFCLTEPMTVREFIQKFNQNFTSYTWANKHGQLSLGLIDTTVAPTVGTPLRDDIDEVESTTAPREIREWTENLIKGKFDFDADAQRYVSTVLEWPETTSQQQLATAGKKTVRSRGTYEGRFIRDLVTFQTAMVQRRLLYAFPPRLIEITMGPTGFNLDIMDRVIVTAFEGYGAQGYVDVPMLIIGHATIPGEAAPVVLRCWDMERVLGSTPMGGSSVTWGSGGQTWGNGSQTWTGGP